MSLSMWSWILGIVFGAFGGALLARPLRMGSALKAFPRSVWAGRILSAVAWIWAAYAINMMGLDFLEPYKRVLNIVAVICIPLTWYWMDNLLSCRALGGILTLFPYELLHVARIHSSPARLVLVVLAYLFIVYGMWLILYPWTLRKHIDWVVLKEGRIRGTAALFLVSALVLVGLGATVLR